MASRDEIRLDITATDDATDVAKRVARVMEGLEEDAVDIQVRAETSQAEDGLDRVNRKTQDTDTSVKKLGDTSDNSRNVLANMVGNSAQDVGQLAGVAGTAGVALGQMAEYAADGNIALGGLLKTAGPMLAIGLAVGFLSDHLNKARQKAEETEDAIRDAVSAVREGNIATAAEKMSELFGDLAGTASTAGVEVDSVFAAIVDGSGVIPGLDQQMEDLWYGTGAAAHLTTSEIEAQRARLVELRDATARAAVTWGVTNGEMAHAETATAAATRALEGLRDEADAATVSFDRLKGALDMEASYLGAVSDADALAGSLSELARLNEDVEATDEDRSDAARAVAEDTNRLRGTVLELVEQYGEIPEEELTRIRAELPAGQQAAFDAWLATIAQGTTVPVRVDLTAALAEAERRLERWRTQWANGGGAAAGVSPRSVGPAPSSVNVTVNAPQGSRPDDIIAAATRYARRNGGSVLTRGRR